MAKRQQPTPFHDDDFIYFELQSPNFWVFDISSEGGLYTVPEFQPGVYRLAMDSIRLASAKDQKKRKNEIIAVDSCLMFLVDAEYVAKFRERLDTNQGDRPNDPYFEKLRKQVGVDFGYATVTSDGNYILDLSQLERTEHGKKLKPTKGRAKPDLYLKVAKRMSTFVCERCFQEELMGLHVSHPELARMAKDQGWLLVPPEGKRESGFFEEFQVVGPKCATHLRKSS